MAVLQRLRVIKSDELFDRLFEAGLQPELVEDDTEITLCCPICDDDRPRLYVSVDSGAWLCFHCGEEGGLHRLFTAILGERASDAYDAVSRLRGRAEEEIDYFEPSSVKREPATPAAILRLPPQFRPISKDSPVVFLNYLAKRHVSPELAASRGVGYAVTGRYAWRVILPVQSDGTLFTYIARTVQTQCPNCSERLDDCTCRPYKFPKVLTPQSREGAHPSLTLYNYDAVRGAKPANPVVVEGAFDALRLPARAVALMTSHASATQIALLAALARGGDLTLCLDGDDAGYIGALKIAEALTSEMVRVKVALLPEGEDPCSVRLEILHKALDSARPFVL